MTARYNLFFVVLSILVAMFASYVALEFAILLTRSKGLARSIWLTCGAFAMGIGIWSMHFVGMLAFDMPGMKMAYDLPLLFLSIFIAIGASLLALYIVSRDRVSFWAFAAGGVAMAGAISGMHYVGMASMRMEAGIRWNYYLVALSILIAIVASFSALFVALHIRKQSERSWLQFLASAFMGIAISGMHYTGMVAATFVHEQGHGLPKEDLVATDGLAIAVAVMTILILGLALASAVVNRAFSLKIQKAETSDRLYREAEKAIIELRQEREIRERFMSALAHDLRTPLTAAMMSAQLGNRHSDNQEVSKHCNRVVETLSRMDGMIQTLLDAHRISAGQALPLALESCNVSDLLASTLEGLTTVHGNRFLLKSDSSLVAEWDVKAIRRALENLCNNAIKYGEIGTPVTVSAHPKEGNLALIGVHNFGDPIPEPEQRKLFGLFQRGQAAEKSGRQGWGLGLSIVKGIVEAHGGKIQAISNLGGGTNFLIEIPLAGAMKS